MSREEEVEEGPLESLASDGLDIFDLANLQLYGAPDDCAHLAQRLHEIANEGGFPEDLEQEARRIARYLMWRTVFTQRTLLFLEKHGLAFDPETREIRFVRESSGRRRKLAVFLVGLAYERVDGDSRPHPTGRDTLAAIREELGPLLPPEEQSDARIKRRLQAYLAARSSSTGDEG